MNRTELHEKLLNFLISQKIVFMPRQTNRAKKLENKNWFLCGDHYTSISFWHGFDEDRKVPNISLIFGNSFPTRCEILLTSRSDSTIWPLFDEIGNNLEFEIRKNGERLKKISEVQNFEDLISAITSFNQNEKLIIDEKISFFKHDKIRMISNDTFVSKIMNLNKYRSTNSQLDFIKSDVIGKKAIRRTKGVLSKSEKEEIRTYLAKTVKVKKKHNKIQNKLLTDLKGKFPQAYIIMEEDYIDLKVETKNEILLFEVKPYFSVIRCVKEALGQLIGYYFNIKNEDNKKVKLIIYGPKKPNKDELNYLKFVKKNMSCTLEYEYEK